MKKLSYIILGVLIGAFATYYFCPRNLDESIEYVKIIKPKGVISVEKAKTLNNNWTRERQQANDSAAMKYGRKTDNRSTWWSLNDIENYLAYSKNQSDSLGYNMTGIRVYLGVYGKNAGQTKKNLTTMFIVPTGKKAHAKASTSVFSFFGKDDNDIPTPPLNDGSGGENGYPQ